ncbi:hypothetical protein [Microbulbifer sp. SSSA005]|uniref:hypothetical protein n=1 Tax=unclassified Microbulbifer TaxID=2619833 RepID=UPI00403A863D
MFKKDFFIGFLVSILGVGYSASTLADMSGEKEIIRMGCHLNDSTCYVTIDEVVGPEECSKNSVRWSSDAVNGQETLAQLMAAFHAKKKVNFYLADTCHSGGYPTFGYFYVSGN